MAEIRIYIFLRLSSFHIYVHSLVEDKENCEVQFAQNCGNYDIKLVSGPLPLFPHVTPGPGPMS